MAKATEQTDETIHQSDQDWDDAAPRNDVCEGEILVFVAKHQEIAGKAAEIRKKKSLLRRHMKNRGVLLKQFDVAMKEMDDADPEATLDQQAALNKYRRWLGVPTNETPDLFVSQAQDEATRAKLAEHQGFIAGHAPKPGQSRDEACPYELNSIEGLEWIKGWHRGQSKLAEGLRELPGELA